MKEIIIESPKYGDHIVLVDDEDFEMVSKIKWHLLRCKSADYAVTNKSDKCRIPLMHRFILGIQDASILVDHKNRNGLDNRKINLRKCTSPQNCSNSVKKRKDGTSKHKGVYYHKQSKKYCAEIKVNYKKKYLGLFKTEDQAGDAYNKAASKYFGEFAKLNLMPCVE